MLSQSPTAHGSSFLEVRFGIYLSCTVVTVVTVSRNTRSSGFVVALTLLPGTACSESEVPVLNLKRLCGWCRRWQTLLVRLLGPDCRDGFLGWFGASIQRRRFYGFEFFVLRRLIAVCDAFFATRPQVDFVIWLNRFFRLVVRCGRRLIVLRCVYRG